MPPLLVFSPLVIQFVKLVVPVDLFAFVGLRVNRVVSLTRNLVLEKNRKGF